MKTMENTYTRRTIRGQDFWVRSFPGVKYVGYQAIGCGNQDGPKEGMIGRRDYHPTAKEALAALKEAEAVVQARPDYQQLRAAGRVW